MIKTKRSQITRSGWYSGTRGHAPIPSFSLSLRSQFFSSLFHSLRPLSFALLPLFLAPAYLSCICHHTQTRTKVQEKEKKKRWGGKCKSGRKREREKKEQVNNVSTPTTQPSSPEYDLTSGGREEGTPTYMYTHQKRGSRSFLECSQSSMRQSSTSLFSLCVYIYTYIYTHTHRIATAAILWFSVQGCSAVIDTKIYIYLLAACVCI